MRILNSAPRVILIYLALLSGMVILNHYHEPGSDNQAVEISEQWKEFEQKGFIVPCPSGHFIILSWGDGILPLGNTGLQGGMLFFARDTICFGKGKNK